MTASPQGFFRFCFWGEGCPLRLREVSSCLSTSPGRQMMKIYKSSRRTSTHGSFFLRFVVRKSLEEVSSLPLRDLPPDDSSPSSIYGNARASRRTRTNSCPKGTIERGSPSSGFFLRLVSWSPAGAHSAYLFGFQREGPGWPFEIACLVPILWFWRCGGSPGSNVLLLPTPPFQLLFSRRPSSSPCETTWSFRFTSSRCSRGFLTCQNSTSFLIPSPVEGPRDPRHGMEPFLWYRPHFRVGMTV